MILGQDWRIIASYTWTAPAGSTITFLIEAKMGSKPQDGKSQDIANNTSYIDVRLRSTVSMNGNGGAGFSFTCSYCPTVSGSNTWYFTDEIITSVENQPVKHNPDGSLTITLTSTVVNNFLGINHTFSGVATLKTIPRTSSISDCTGAIGSTANFAIYSNSSSFSHIVKFVLGTSTLYLNASGNLQTTSTKISGGNKVVNIPTSYYSQNVNAKYGSMTGTIYCDTYIGNTLIGSATSRKLNISCNESLCKPEVSSINVSDINEKTLGVTHNSNRLIDNQSLAQFVFNYACKNGATLKKILISDISQNIVGLNQTTGTATFSKVAAGDFYTIDVWDSREFHTAITLQVNEDFERVPYFVPTLNAAIKRTSQVSDEMLAVLNGTWFNGLFDTDYPNTISATWKAREKNGAWFDGQTSLGITTLNNEFTNADGIKIENPVPNSNGKWDYQKVYEIEVEVVDLLSLAEKAETITKGIEDFGIFQNAIRFKGEKIFEHKNGKLSINQDLQIGSQNKTLLDIINDFGTIMEIGYNSNGNFIKYKNGLLICFARITTTSYNDTYKYNSAVWTYPSKYISAPVVNISANDWSTNVVETKVYAYKDTCNCMAHQIAYNSYALSKKAINLNLTAIGMWE